MIAVPSVATEVCKEQLFPLTKEKGTNTETIANVSEAIAGFKQVQGCLFL